VTQVGEGPRAAKSTTAPSSGPSVGETLAERYRLEQHINNDSAGRQVWRAVDIVLRRPVAVVLRHPGGTSAEEMLSAAVTASRVVHGNLIGVYDAIDEGSRAYVVREWIDGGALRDLVLEEGPLDAERTTSILHAVSQAVSALHASGMPHGNVHPGTVLIADDGRIVLADARVDTHTSTEADVRAIAAIGYFMLTGHWPRREAGSSVLPDAMRESTGALVAPRRVRAGVPAYLDNLIIDLLNPELALPTAQVLTTDLARLDTSERLLLGGAGTLRFGEETAEPSRNSTPRLVMVGGVALALVIAGMVLGVKALNANDGAPEALPSAGPSGGNASPAVTAPKKLVLRADQIRIVDPPDGNRAELKNSALMVDNNPVTLWKTDRYGGPTFHNKPGMGILIKFDQPVKVSSVQVQMTTAGATAQIWSGDNDPGDTSTGDQTISETFKPVGEKLAQHPSTTMVFPLDGATAYPYLMIWFTGLPAEANTGGYRISVQEIAVQTP
jgi:eukaryotic-like serine/threonine-protein kinase